MSKEIDLAIDELLALDMMHGASKYITKQFHYGMPHVEAKANLEARAILFGCCNAIFRKHGCGITREEVEGSEILEHGAQCSEATA